MIRDNPTHPCHSAVPDAPILPVSIQVLVRLCQIRGVIVGCYFLMDSRVAIIRLRRHQPEMQGERQTIQPMRDNKEIASRIADDFGANATYVEDLLRQFQHNPKSVDEEWSDYFQSLLSDGLVGDGSVKVESVTTNGAVTAPVVAEQPAPAATPAPAAAGAAQPAAAGTTAGERIQIRGTALRIVENMESSLAVPTATSARQIQIKLLDENRRWVNRHLEAQGDGKTSYTHFIAWAMIKALEKYPQMNDGYEGIDGVSYRVRRQDVNLGVAVDVQKKDGSRSLLVPNIKGANRMSFKQFVDAYQDVVKRARDGKLQVSDFQGTTISLTNPGTIGTAASAPRLMAGQGAIIATGAIEYPPEYAAMTGEALSQLGISKVFTITSTYDHRIIQGAESGMFLAYIHELLLGKHDFYDEIFADIGITYKPLRWSVDVNPLLLGVDRERQEIRKQARLFEFINAYRVRGHLIADIDPLNMVPIHEHPELEAETYDLSIWDLDRSFFTGGLGGRDEATFREIWGMLIRFYCGKIGIESRHIQSKEQKQWIRERIEQDPPPLPPEIRKQLLQKLIAAEQFEKFLHTKYIGQKRFSVEGGESIIPILDRLITGAGERGASEVVLGMAHRGRLNVLANVIGHFCERIFTSFEGSIHPSFPADEGDVKYHQGADGERETADGKTIRLRLSPNPSHLEAVDPVVEGMTRATQDEMIDDSEAPREQVMNRALAVLLHGDAAFAGQGIVMETLQLAQLKGYRTGGTIHIIINNQIGFTTSPEEGRSSIYSTDVARMTQAPIFHINGDDPEAAYRTMRMALDYRQTFHKDVVLDVVGFRRLGHNETDEPSYTMPLLYQRVKEHPGVLAVYAKRLIKEGVIDEAGVNELIEERIRRYEDALARAKKVAAEAKASFVPEPEVVEIDGSAVIETSVTTGLVKQITQQISVVPEGFHQIGRAHV